MTQNKEDLQRRLKEASREELRNLVISSAKKLGEAQRQNAQQAKLITDFQVQRKRQEDRAQGIIVSANRQAEAIKADAIEQRDAAERRIKVIDEEISAKLSHAETEADSIIETRLRKATTDIDRLERRREEAKRSAIQLNNAISEQYDRLIVHVERQISSYKEMQERLDQFNADIEAEDFKKFNINDYVTNASSKNTYSATAAPDSVTIGSRVATPMPIMSVDDDDLGLDDDEMSSLSALLTDEADLDEYNFGDSSYNTTNTDFDDSLLDDADLSYLATDDDDDDDLYNTGGISFTGSFMAIPQQKNNEDDFDALDDMDIDGILDDDDDDDFDDFLAPSPSTINTNLKVPSRTRPRRSGSSASSWL